VLSAPATIQPGKPPRMKTPRPGGSDQRARRPPGAPSAARLRTECGQDRGPGRPDGPARLDARGSRPRDEGSGSGGGGAPCCRAKPRGCGHLGGRDRGGADRGRPHRAGPASCAASRGAAGRSRTGWWCTGSSRAGATTSRCSSCGWSTASATPTAGGTRSSASTTGSGWEGRTRLCGCPTWPARRWTSTSAATP
jgi:hypothetical protein